MEQAVHFTEEKNFDREGYDTCLRRLNYDDRDVVMYENMLAFLWEYAVRPGCLADYKGLLSEYSRWNMCFPDAEQVRAGRSRMGKI